MRESGLWKTMRRNLPDVPGAFHMVRIEDSAGVGTPDVNLCCRGVEAWVELKHRDEYPAREGTPITLPHFTQQQKDWLRARGEAGGGAWLVVQVERDYYLFDWRGAQKIEQYPRALWVATAWKYWPGRCDWCAMLHVIAKGADF